MASSLVIGNHEFNRKKCKKTKRRLSCIVCSVNLKSSIISFAPLTLIFYFVNPIYLLFLKKIAQNVQSSSPRVKKVSLPHYFVFSFSILLLTQHLRFMDKKLCLKLNGGRQVTGILRGFDPFMNLVVDESIEECKDGSKNNVGMVVSLSLTLPVFVWKIYVDCYF